MKTLTFLSVMLFALALSASEGPVEQLSQLYKSGTVPDKTRLSGWYAGRCYNSDKPNSAYAGLLSADVIEVSSDGGPLFPPTKSLVYSVIVSYGWPPNVFENLTDDIRSQVTSVIQSEASLLTP